MAYYAAGPADTVYRTAVALFVLCASFGIVLTCFHAPWMRRLGLRQISIAVGLLLGMAAVIQRGQSSSFTALPAESIIRYEFELTDDSTRARTGEAIHRGRLVEVSSRDGTRATARGPIIVAGGDRVYHWGERLRAAGTPKRTRAGWTARCPRDKLETLGTSKPYFRLRNVVRAWVERRLVALRPTDQALFLALFLGVRDDLSGPDIYFFRRAGCVHLLALSGFHLGILSFLIVGALAPLLGKRRGVAVAAVLLAGYLFIAGPKVSLMRAVLMFGIMGGSRLAGIRVRGTDLLGVTFLLCLLAWPWSLATLSFELSYLALAGIMVLSPPIEASSATTLPRVLRAPLAASIGAQIATSPVLASRFAVLYPIGILSSVVLTPLVTAYLWAGLAYVFVPLPPAARRLIALFLRWVHRGVILFAEHFARVAPLHVGDGRTALAAGAAVLIGCVMVLVLRFRAARRR